MRSFFKANLAAPRAKPVAQQEQIIHPIGFSSQVHHEAKVITKTNTNMAEYKHIVRLKYLFPKKPIKIPSPIKTVPEM